MPGQADRPDDRPSRWSGSPPGPGSRPGVGRSPPRPRRQSSDIDQALTGDVAALVASANDAAIAAGADGGVTVWNTGAARLYGYSAPEMLGRHISLVAPPGSVDTMARFRECVDKGQRVDEFETMRRTKSGDLIPVSMALSPTRDADGQLLGLSLVHRDVTQHVQGREELRALIEREFAGEPELLPPAERSSTASPEITA